MSSVVGTFWYFTHAPFMFMCGTFYVMGKSKNFIERTLEISLSAKNDFYVVLMPLCIHMVLLIWLIGVCLICS
jgi:hypothetical protein